MKVRHRIDEHIKVISQWQGRGGDRTRSERKANGIAITKAKKKKRKRGPLILGIVAHTDTGNCLT